jgi:hypothetical protein
MRHRIAIAAAYTFLVLAILLTWPRWASPPQVDNATVITATTEARWLVILTPILWGWAALSLKGTWTRRMALIGSLILLGACFLFIWYHDNVLGYTPCLWDRDCGGWFK